MTCVVVVIQKKWLESLHWLNYVARITRILFLTLFLGSDTRGTWSAPLATLSPSSSAWPTTSSWSRPATPPRETCTPSSHSTFPRSTSSYIPSSRPCAARICGTPCSMCLSSRDGEVPQMTNSPQSPVLVYGRIWHPVQVLSTDPYYARVVKIGPPVRYRS